MINGLYVIGVMIAFIIALTIKWEWDNRYRKN